jgi:hypothetical protein
MKLDPFEELRRGMIVLALFFSGILIVLIFLIFFAAKAT